MARPQRVFKIAHSTSGFVLLEWLIGVFILAVAAMGYATLMTTSADMAPHRQAAQHDQRLQAEQLKFKHQLARHRHFLQSI